MKKWAKLGALSVAIVLASALPLGDVVGLVVFVAGLALGIVVLWNVSWRAVRWAVVRRRLQDGR